MKKTNRFALLALVSGILASALVMGCGGGESTDTAATDSANAMGNTTGNAVGNTAGNAAGNAAP